MASPYDGILLIHKTEGKTSFDVVKRVRHLLRVKKVGHAGTLDPFATGLLIVLLGQGTKLFPFLVEGEKVYQAVMRLGVETDTQDLTGRVIREGPVPELELETIRRKALGFVGEIEQIPPSFSAVNYKGKRAYILARQGRQVELEKRKVRIHSIEVNFFDPPDLGIRVACSKGTYLRSLAADLGRALGPGAHLRSLRRLSSGPFHVNDAVELEHLKGEDPVRKLVERVIPLVDALPQTLEREVGSHLAQRIRRGYQPGWEELGGENHRCQQRQYVKLIRGRELVAVGEACNGIREGGKSLKIMRVFH